MSDPRRFLDEGGDDLGARLLRAGRDLDGEAARERSLTMLALHDEYEDRAPCAWETHAEDDDFVCDARTSISGVKLVPRLESFFDQLGQMEEPRSPAGPTGTGLPSEARAAPAWRGATRKLAASAAALAIGAAAAGAFFYVRHHVRHTEHARAAADAAARAGEVGSAPAAASPPRAGVAARPQAKPTGAIAISDLPDLDEPPARAPSRGKTPVGQSPDGAKGAGSSGVEGPDTSMVPIIQDPGFDEAPQKNEGRMPDTSLVPVIKDPGF